MSQLTRCFVVPRAIKAISSSSSGYITKVQSAGILDVKLSELHEKLHTSEEIAPQLRGLRLHDHHSYGPAAVQVPVPETPISEYLKNKEQRDSRFRDLAYREVHARVRGVYNQSLKSPPPSKKPLSQLLAAASIAAAVAGKDTDSAVPKYTNRHGGSSEPMFSRADLDNAFDLLASQRCSWALFLRGEVLD